MPIPGLLQENLAFSSDKNGGRYLHFFPHQINHLSKSFHISLNCLFIFVKVNCGLLET